MYPEHEKLEAIKDESQAIGAFLDWLQNERQPTLQLCAVTNHTDHPFQPIYFGIQELLAEYFDINLKKIEAEKNKMLKEIRKNQ